MQDREQTQRSDAYDQQGTELVDFSLNMEDQKVAQDTFRCMFSFDQAKQSDVKILHILTEKEHNDNVFDVQIQKLVTSEIYENLNSQIQCLIQSQDVVKLQVRETIHQHNMLKDFANGTIFLHNLPQIEQEHDSEQLAYNNHKKQFELMSQQFNQHQDGEEYIKEEEKDKQSQKNNKQNIVTLLRKSQRLFKQTSLELKRQNILTEQISETPEFYFGQSQSQKQSLFFEDQDSIRSKPKQAVLTKKQNTKSEKKAITKKTNRNKQMQKCIKHNLSSLNYKSNFQVKKHQEDLQSYFIQTRVKKGKQKLCNKVKINYAQQKIHRSKPTGKKPYNPQMERELSLWIQKLLAKEIRLTQRTIRQEAKKIMERQYDSNFKASNGWLQKFYKRHPSIFALIRQKNQAKLEDLEIISNQQTFNFDLIYERHNQNVKAKIQQQE